MRRITTLALIASFVLSACSGHGGGSMLPSANMDPGKPSSFGMHTTRATSVAVAPAGWATTATQAISLANATDLGALPTSTNVTVHIALQLRNTDALKQAISAGQTMDKGTFIATYSPTSTQAQQVASYLQNQGFSNVSIEPNNLFVSGTASAAQVQSAFNTKLEQFSLNGANVFANVQPAYVPTNLGGLAIAVLGLNNAAAMKSGPKKVPATPTPAPTATPTPAPTPTPTPPPTADKCRENAQGLCVRFYDPGTYQLVYDAANVPTASNTNIAIFTWGQLSQSISDFRVNEQKFGLPQVPVSIVQVDPMSSDTSGSDEWTLDMTYSSGIAANVGHIYLYNGQATDTDIAMMYNKWVTDDIAQIGNSSFGLCEAFPYQDGSMIAADEVLNEAAAQGQTMFVSSGDTGFGCSIAGVPPNGAPGGAPLVEYPASSPYVVAVGGTDLFSNPDGTYMGEDAWEAGGGGISQFEYSPYWESWAQPIGTTPVGLTFRGVPDVAMDASLETGALLYTGGSAVNGGTCSPCITGGTSLASPLAAGSYARMQTAHGNALGFGAIAFYKIYQQNASPSETSAGPPPWRLIGGFHDILSGTNGAYTALPSYDYTTGLGSFDVAKTNAIIGK